MTRVRGVGKPTTKLFDKEDSTSAQGGDVSSLPSATEEITDDMNILYTKRASILKERQAKLVQFLHPRHAHERQNTKLSNEDNEVPPSTTFPEIVDLEDGGYDGDAEIQYPDAYEDIDNQSNKSRSSLLTLNGSSGDESLTGDMERLQFKHANFVSAGSARKHRRSFSGKHSTTNKRTYSESFDSLSSDDIPNPVRLSSNSPAQKKARRRSQVAERCGDQNSQSGDEMDLSQ